MDVTSTLQAMPSSFVDILRLKPVRAFILDITGVLYTSAEHGDGFTIPGSIEAVDRLYSESRVVFLSNESSGTQKRLHEKLSRLGFNLRQEDLITPAPLAAEYARKARLRPYLLTRPGLASVFGGIAASSPEEADCVLMADAESDFTYDNMNTALRILLRQKDPLLITLGNGKFWQRSDGPCLDVGSYALALEFATGARRVLIGKPSETYFQAALDHLGVAKDEAVMIGDDILSDVGGAQNFGLRAVQVRTGKWRPDWERHPTVTPDLIVDDLSTAVRHILAPFN